MLISITCFSKLLSCKIMIWFCLTYFGLKNTFKDFSSFLFFVLSSRQFLWLIIRWYAMAQTMSFTEMNKQGTRGPLCVQCCCIVIHSLKTGCVFSRPVFALDSLGGYFYESFQEKDEIFFPREKHRNTQHFLVLIFFLIYSME